MINNIKFFIILIIIIFSNCFKEWWEDSKVIKIKYNIYIQAFDLTDDNYDDYVGQKKYVLVKFYTKWCHYCRLLSPEYDRLVEILNNTRKDILIARLESGANDITSNKYGINQIPIVTLFQPGSKKIYTIYQGIREGEHMAKWIEQLCPKIDIKEEDEKINNKKDNSNQESLHIDLDFINNRNQLTDKKEYIKQQFFSIKKKLDEIEKKIEKVKNKNDKKTKNKKIRITFDFSFINIFLTAITLLIIFAFYKTGRKLLINAGNIKIEDINLIYLIINFIIYYLPS